ncbi:inactive protein RESTRICTED TEV MOVEMENT 2-like [Cucurbita maxima]|uniref:Inactive protein RESTRICTED TEV MOVEMENT 2-like n=1 Tax=Cucurbita maxima TaxID=3661 RepID=A0A6J1JKU5_CUCMA|nr:inactive protein RESTRICTED TEV MOVEMENT 2-like [Cucurbita maxima]
MPMDSSSKSYQDFEPLIDWLPHPDPESHLLLVHLLGFTRNDLKVQVTSTGKLRISGERRLTSGKWLRFLKEIHIPEDADLNKISAKLEKGILYVTQPKKTSAVSSNNLPVQPPKPKAESQPPPTAAKPTDRPNTPKSPNERPQSQANGKQSPTPLKPHEGAGAPASTQKSAEKPTVGGGEPVQDLAAKDRTEKETEDKAKAHTKLQDASEKTRKEEGKEEIGSKMGEKGKEGDGLRMTEGKEQGGHGRGEKEGGGSRMVEGKERGGHGRGEKERGGSRMVEEKERGGHGRGKKEGGVAEGSEWTRRGEWLWTNMVNLALGAAVFVIVYLNLTKNDHMEEDW